MVKKIQGKKLLKRSKDKSNFKKFVDSNYTDFAAFNKACKNIEDLMIYNCLKPDELAFYIDKIRNIEPIEEKIKWLKNNQPPMNANEERFNTCVESIASFLKNYIAYNGFIMNNGSGDAEDWTSEFWLKYTKVCNFYRERWFHPENLKRETTVTYEEVKYKEFVYISRMSITGERRHQAFLATQKPEATLFKPSLDFQIDSKSENEKSLLDVVKDPYSDHELTEDKTNIGRIIDTALAYAKKYENGKYFDQIALFYQNQDTTEIKDRKVIILAKVFLYKAGLVSPKTLSFVKSLSSKYKAKFNISTALISQQSSEFKRKKTIKVPSYSDVLEDEGKTKLGLILRKRGTLDYFSKTIVKK